MNSTSRIIIINSCGGNVYDGLALIDIVEESETPVHTICVGSCMSMGLWVWLAGAKRFVGKSSTLMFHDVSTLTMGKSEVVKQELAEMLRIQEKLIKEITGKSAIPEEKLRDYINRKAEWYIPAEEAIALKLADQYYE